MTIQEAMLRLNDKIDDAALRLERRKQRLAQLRAELADGSGPAILGLIAHDIWWQERAIALASR